MKVFILSRILTVYGCKRRISPLLGDRISAPIQLAVTGQIRTVSFDLGLVQSVSHIQESKNNIKFILHFRFFQ